MVEFPEELSKQVPQAAACRFRRAEVPGGGVEPGANVTRDVRSEPVEVLHPWKHLRDEPQPTQREKGLPPERQVEIDFVDCGTDLTEPDGRPAAQALDGGIDPNPGDVGAVGDAQALRYATGGRCHEVATGGRLREGRQRARPRHRLEHQGHIFGGARHRAFDLKGVPCPIRRIGRNEPDRRPEPHHSAERCGNTE